MRVVITRNHLVDRAGHSTRMSLRPVPSGLETAGDVDLVEAWRMPGDDRLLWMRGVTTSYRVDPVSEYVIGVTHGRAYRLHRGRSTRIVRTGQLVVLDPALPHSGSPAERGPWAGRLLVVELRDFRDALFDEDDALLDLAFPGPVIGDPHLTRRFLALHRDAARGTSALEWQSTLLAFFADLAARSPSAGPRRSRTARDDPAVRRAVEYLHTTSAATSRWTSWRPWPGRPSIGSPASSRTPWASHPTPIRLRCASDSLAGSSSAAYAPGMSRHWQGSPIRATSTATSGPASA